MNKIYLGIILLHATIIVPVNVSGQNSGFRNDPLPGEDTTKIIFPVKENSNYPYGDNNESPMYLKTPENIEEHVEYNPETNEYEVTKKIGNRYYSPPVTMSIEEYTDYQHKKALKKYWGERARGDNYDSRSSFMSNITIGGKAFDKVFGSNTINITPQGSAELIFGFNLSKIDNPQVAEKLRKTPSFTFEEKIQMNVRGTIGDKMELGINYNTEATFDFENKTKLEYTGEEDEIIKKIEAGNVTLPLSGSLITGSQSLFGFKTELQFGKLYVTSVFSQQKGETSVIQMEGGAQMNEFEVPVIEYDANRHFFLSQYFRDHYEEALKNLPVINSQITITKIEVWVTNRGGSVQDKRGIVAATDLGEPRTSTYVTAFKSGGTGSYPSNGANSAYGILNNNNLRNSSTIEDDIKNLNIADFDKGSDYVTLRARQLKPSEFKFHPNLGFISLNSALNSDEVLAVAYEYNIGGQTFRVGDFSTSIDNPAYLFVKLIKGTSLSPDYPPTWKLMMKNVYAIGAYQLNPEDFELNILYLDDKTGTGIPYLNEGKQNKNGKKELLLRVFNLDKINTQGDAIPDGLFDIYEGISVYKSNGRIFLPALEPFGEFLKNKITGGPTTDEKLLNIADNYIFEELYTQSQTAARQQAEKNKFVLKGKYKSSSSNEIMLNAMNVPQGSVKVTAGGQQLVEGQDYTVDYTLGRVKIINQGLLESGAPISVSLESNSLFNIQTKTMIGTNLNYRFSDDFIIGGTILRLNERPLTTKVNIGEEPISNTIWGLNGSYTTKSQFLTTMVDKIPLVETKEVSQVTVDGEFAQLIPGQSKTISKSGIAYIDDFEGTETSYELKTYHSWNLASTPEGQTEKGMFPEGEMTGLASGYNRAKIAWYTIDPLFLRNISSTPGNIKNNDAIQKSHYVREIYEEELFPEKDRRNDEPPTITVLNVAYYPKEIGPYNYVVDGSGDIKGLTSRDTLDDPASRWGGIMRSLTTTDFEEANVEFIEFWLMDPFVEKPDHPGGTLFFNLGDISEDVLKDSKQSFEQGLPAEANPQEKFTTSEWARIPTVEPLINAFDGQNETGRKYQDVGMDGVKDGDEEKFFTNYKTNMESRFGSLPNNYDYSHDDYHYPRGTDYDNMGLDILTRYKNYNNHEGNSPVSADNPETYPTSATIAPDNEDINLDYTLNTSENYYQYSVNLNPEELNINNPYIVNVRKSNRKNNKGQSVNWYQFKIPIKDPERIVGSLNGFNSIRFIRMFLKGWDQEVVLRFAKLELVRSEWRKYELPLIESCETTSASSPDTKFDVSSVNIEENSEKQPIPYILPPGIDRAVDPTNTQLQQLNEQSIVFKVTDLGDQDSRAAFKTISMDMRQYKRLKMDVHAEEIYGYPLGNYEITAFIRLGTDYTHNYYEYEIPLKLTPHGNYNNSSEDDRQIVWPRENFFNIDLGEFLQAKQQRLEEQRVSGSINFNEPFPYYPYVEEDGYKQRKITIVGNPTLSDVRVIMIGIRNPSDCGLTGDIQNDRVEKSVEVWMNELRLTDFKDDGGWAANARVQTKLADFGTVNVAGSIITPGFGSIEKKVNERYKEEIKQYDLSANLQLGKFFPEKAKVNIPMYVGFSEQLITPQYNPLDEDIPLEEAIEIARRNGGQEAVDSIKYYTLDKTTRKSINFTNVKVNKQSKKPMPWDPANFSISYAYNEIMHRDVETEYDWEFNHKGTFNYMYSLRPKNVTPLKKVKSLNNKYLRIIKDFNFYYLPSRISYRTDVVRNYNETKKRNLGFLNNQLNEEIEATASRNFLFNWYFDIKYDLARSLKLDYSATNMARFEETDFLLRDDQDRDDFDVIHEEWKRTLWESVHNFGDNTSFSHKMNASYNVPINKIPFLSWTSLQTRYSATYEWLKGPELNFEDGTDEEEELERLGVGNIINNTNNIQINSTLTLTTLYNKSAYLKRINQSSGKKQPAGKKEMKKVEFVAKEINLYTGRGKTIEHRLKTEKVNVKVFEDSGNEITSISVNVLDQNRVRITSEEEEFKNVTVIVEGEVEKKENPFIFILENGTRALMGVRNVAISYNNSNNNTIHGFNRNHKSTTFLYDPGWEYIFGSNNIDEIQNRAEDRGWLDETMSINPMIWSKKQTLNLRSNVEPFEGFRVDLNSSWTETKSFEEFYDQLNDVFTDVEFETGNTSVSIITIKTAFGKNVHEDNYNNFKEYRTQISQRLYNENIESIAESYNLQNRDNIILNRYFTVLPDSIDGYKNGYGPTSQEVVIPAFFAAYTGKDIQNISLKPLETIRQMLPNWRVTYDGLSKIDFLKKHFRSINISHSYESKYNVSSYRNNTFYRSDSLFLTDQQGNFLPEYEIGGVSIREQFSPLFRIDMNWVNNLTTRFEISKSRNINLTLSNNQITELRTDEYSVGIGYRFKDVQLFLNQRTYKSDINVRGEFSVRDNISEIRTFARYDYATNEGQPISGQRVVSLKFNADYVLNERFDLRFFYDQVINKPYVTTTFPTANTNVGLSITFRLQ